MARGIALGSVLNTYFRFVSESCVSESYGTRQFSQLDELNPTICHMCVCCPQGAVHDGYNHTVILVKLG